MTPILGILASAIQSASVVKAGYVFGGINGGYSSTIQKLLMPADTISNLSDTMSNSVDLSLASFANSPTAGYACGGRISGDYRNSIDKLTFATDARTTIAATLGAKRAIGGGHSNNGTAGYTMGGQGTGGGDTSINVIQKLTYSNDTISTPAATLSANIAQMSGFANSGTAGYGAGGASDDGATKRNIFAKLLYSNDTRSNLSATLTSARGATSAMANSGTAGYISGGLDSANASLSGIDKLTFSNETKSTLSATLSTACYFAGSFSNNGVAGYICGGQTDTGYLNTIQKIDFSNDTKSTIAATLTREDRFGSSSFANTGSL